MAATGQVYIFNTTNQSIKVEINDDDLDGPLAPSSGKDGSYQPSVVPVMRNDASSTPDAVFATNTNLEFKFAGTSQTYSQVKIDPSLYPTNTDLVLYIFNGSIMIYSPVNNAVVYSKAAS